MPVRAERLVALVKGLCLNLVYNLVMRGLIDIGGEHKG